jgi:hypothetical protein
MVKNRSAVSSLSQQMMEFLPCAEGRVCFCLHRLAKPKQKKHKQPHSSIVTGGRFMPMPGGKLCSISSESLCYGDVSGSHKE